MPIISAGLLMYRVKENNLEVFLVHPGGPYFKNKDEGWWTIPKGLPEGKEVLLDAAVREFYEETGISPTEPFITLGSIKQKGGKQVQAWAFEGDWQESNGIKCNTFELEWPPRTGKRQQFAEVDKAAWMEEDIALTKINVAQQPLIYTLKVHLNL